MFDPKTFSFDAEKMSEFFRNNDFTKALSTMKMPGLDGEAIMEAQKKNMDALVEANKAAAAGYQDLFKKQMSIFEETMSEAQKYMASLDATKLDPETAKAQGELAKAAFEKAIANMQALAEGDAAHHDSLIIELARDIENVDAVLLAQFSMARARPGVEQIVSAPVLTSPDSAVRKLQRLLAQS